MSGPYGPQQGGPYGPQQGSPAQGSGQYGGPNPGPGAPWSQAPSGPGGFGPPPSGPGSAGPGYQPGGQPGPGQGGPGQFGGPGQRGPRPADQWAPPKPARAPLDLGQILPLLILGFGVVGFIAGFLKYQSVTENSVDHGLSIFAGGQGYLPVLILLAGLLGAAHLLPGGKRYPLPTALLAVVVLLGTLVAVFSSGLLAAFTDVGETVSKGFGLWLLLIAAIIQTAAAVIHWITTAQGTDRKPRAAAGSSGAGSSGPSRQVAPSPGDYSGYGPPATQNEPPPAYGGYGQGTPDAAGYGGGYGQGAPEAAGYGGYGQGAPETSGYGGYPSGPKGQDDGPGPDVTQQVRF